MSRVVPIPAGSRFWDRHANPASGWSRLLAYPVLVAALYARSWRLFVLVVIFIAVNPVLFPPRTRPTDDWMYRGVRAEQAWLAAGNPIFGLGFPELLNVLNLPATAMVVLAALRREPIATVAWLAISMALKVGFVQSLIDWHEKELQE